MAGKAASEEPVTMDVFTTALGTVGIKGIVPVGSRQTISPAAFSEKWMKPCTINDSKKLTKYRNDLKRAAEAE